MKRIVFLAAVFASVLFGCTRSTCPVDYVDPFVGTGYHGHTYPGASAPYGMVQLSPDTRTEGWDACSGYHYDDSEIIGFSHTHLSGTGCADLLHAFSHADEQASCGYYSVEFPKEGIRAEMTATPRTGVHRYVFNKGVSPRILIDLNHATEGEKTDTCGLEVLSGDEISGMRRTDGWVADQNVFFDARFSVPFSDVRILSGKQVLLSFKTVWPRFLSLTLTPCILLRNPCGKKPSDG